MKNKPKMTKKEQSHATIQRLLKVAMDEFSEKGYGKASTEKIVMEADMTRGALYHHFKDKKGLFFEVFREAQLEIGRRIEKYADAENDLWGALIAGCNAFLKACSDPKLQQIVVIDAPSVLDWNTYREVDSTMQSSGLSLLRECLQDLIDQKMIQPLPLEALTHLISGAMDEAALWIAQSENPQEALVDAQRTLEIVLNGLKI